MAEKEPQFKVSDRRKFTLEGELRDGEETPTESPISATPVETTPVAETVQTAAETNGAGGAEEDEMPEPTAAESAQQKVEYHASSRKLDELLRQANPGAEDAPVINFTHLAQSIYMTAAMQMGISGDANEQGRVDIGGARQSIDMLGVLEEKTKGNLSEEEKRLLQTVLFDLRMSFRELINQIAEQARRRPSKPSATR